MSSSLNPTHHLPNQRSTDKRAYLQVLSSATGQFPLSLVTQEGQMHVHTAPFRGSFSVVLSEALRAAGLGRKVMIAQFLKGGVNQGPENPVKLCGGLKWIRPDISCCISDSASKDSSKNISKTNQKAVTDIWETCKTEFLHGELDQIVLDEIGLAISLNYLNEKELLSTLDQRPKSMDVVFTGPSIPSQVIERADQVTKLRCCF